MNDTKLTVVGSWNGGSINWLADWFVPRKPLIDDVVQDATGNFYRIAGNGNRLQLYKLDLSPLEDDVQQTQEDASVYGQM